MLRWAVAGVLVAGAALALGLGGPDALVVFVFLAFLAGALAYAAAVGGEWIREASRGRFDRDERR